MSHAGQYLPGNSLLHRLDPRGKFFGFLILIIAAVLTDSPLGYLLLFAVAGGIVALSGLPVQVVLGTVLRMGRFFVLIFVLNTLFFSSETPIFHWWIITISREGMVQGANVVLRIIVILILSNAFTLTTPPMAIMGGIEDLLAPLGYLGLPVEQAAMILSVAVQFIPTLLEETDISLETELRLRELISQKNYFGVEELVAGENLPENLQEAFTALPQMFGNAEVLERARALTASMDERLCTVK